MKAHVKNIIGGAALGLALLAPTIPLWAGYSDSPPTRSSWEPIMQPALCRQRGTVPTPRNRSAV